MTIFIFNFIFTGKKKNNKGFTHKPNLIYKYVKVIN